MHQIRLPANVEEGRLIQTHRRCVVRIKTLPRRKERDSCYVICLSLNASVEVSFRLKSCRSCHCLVWNGTFSYNGQQHSESLSFFSSFSEVETTPDKEPCLLFHTWNRGCNMFSSGNLNVYCLQQREGWAKSVFKSDRLVENWHKVQLGRLLASGPGGSCMVA